MAMLKYLVPALAVVGSAYAQCSTKGTMTITNTADATQLASCATYTGTIALSKKAVGDFALDGPKKVVGDIIAMDSIKLTSISSSTLQTIEGEMNFQSLGALVTLSFPMFSEADSIVLSNLGSALTSLDFTTGVSAVKSLTVAGTSLLSLEGISPTMANVVSVTANTAISSLDLALSNVTSKLTITGNNNGLSVSLPKLQYVGNMQINNCSSISLPALSESDEEAAFNGNYFKALSMPSLKTTGALVVGGNSMLKSISVPKLTTVNGALTVKSNNALTGALSFPKVSKVAGAPIIYGAFSSLTMPQLSSVGGKMTIISTKNIKSTCNHFEGLGTSIVRGTVDCKPNYRSTKPKPSNSGNGGHGGSSGNGGSGGGSGGPNAAGHTKASLTFAACGALAALFFVLV